mmetsp:Transcript_30459/g.94549  ORF Transcript_30459/g.94549 Transcript_30459/m.94549 type:complete len:207 (+) Transcript_30459:847-1467(+)
MQRSVQAPRLPGVRSPVQRFSLGNEGMAPTSIQRFHSDQRTNFEPTTISECHVSSMHVTCVPLWRQPSRVLLVDKRCLLATMTTSFSPRKRSEGLMSTEPSPAPSSALMGKRTSDKRLSSRRTAGRRLLSSGSGRRRFSAMSATMTATGKRSRALLPAVLRSSSSAGFCTKWTRTMALAARKQKKRGPTLNSGHTCQQTNWFTYTA